ncbi:hypothetical protein AJ79_07296 [Helicocarpus griseus UAMH5409]|uniref:Mob1 family protein n=1 Tax=Helicocarpus griseus UAMH5409 TaxID=1447875 RepID=A0A2B7WWF1_9EURO|nr:hypothetical protein AJ79_07296 [Helicocarpus griseus UAMH5409]
MDLDFECLPPPSPTSDPLSPAFDNSIFPLFSPHAASPHPVFLRQLKMTAAGASSQSSPRLPSPPPFTEVQIGPQSPTVGDGFGPSNEELLAFPHEPDNASMRRIRPGTKSADMASGPPLVPLSQLDSPFQLQEHLKALYQHYTRPSDSSTLSPITRDVARYLAEPPEGVERSLWLYELCRFLTMKANNLIIAFFAESPPCSAQTCPEMRASEWQYLCAVHDPPKSCCAIDYCCHTLDWATNILTSPKYFPSRLTLGLESSGGPQASMKHLTNVFRRVYRIFAHAWFQHREVFWQVEGHDGLYIFFKTVCDVYNLIPEDNYTIPPEAEGVQPSNNTDAERDPSRRMTILRKEPESQPEKIGPEEQPEPAMLNVAATTRRHKASPSTGIVVSTITEAAEDDDAAKNTHIPEEEDSVLKLPGASASETEVTDPFPAASVEALPNGTDPAEASKPETADVGQQSESDTRPAAAIESAPENTSPEKKESEVPESSTTPVNPISGSEATEAAVAESLDEKATVPEKEPPKTGEIPRTEVVQTAETSEASETADKDPDSPQAPTTAIEAKPDSDKPF